MFDLISIQALLKSMFSSIFRKENIPKIIEFSVLGVLFIGSFFDGESFLILAVIALLFSENILGILYSEYDTKHQIIFRNFVLISLLVLYITQVNTWVFLLLSISLYVGNYLLLNIGVPNLATSANMASGILSIYYSCIGNPLLAMFFIICAGIFDFTDGPLARWFNKDKGADIGEKGALSDSISDFISFGIAPGVFIFYSIEINIFLALILSIFYGICVLGRLIHFTKSKDKKDEENKKKDFEGLPSPAAAITVSVGVFLLPEILSIMLIVFTSIAMITFSLEWVHFKKLLKDIKIIIISFGSLFILIYGMKKGTYIYLYPFFFANIAYAFSPYITWLKNKIKKR